jgi:hypothetical protein
MKNSGMIAAVALAAGISEEQASKIEINAAFIKQYLPAVAGELTGEGITAERERIAGIEAFSLPGHEKIIAEHKADSKKTPLDAGLAVAAAQRAMLAKQVEHLVTDETKVAGLRSEPANPSTPEKKAPTGLVGEAKWKAEWDTDAKLQAEFLTQADYVALMRAEASGSIKRFLPPNRAA